MIQRASAAAGAAFSASVAAATAAIACDPVLTIAYVDSAPYDTLRLVNASAGAWALIETRIDFAESAGRLVLDTAVGGAGAGSWRPFERVGGAPARSVLGAVDGSQQLSIAFDGVAAGASATFGIDLDDTLPPGSAPTRVSFSEIEGATATARFIGPGGFDITIGGSFGPDGSARLEPGACS